MSSFSPARSLQKFYRILFGSLLQPILVESVESLLQVSQYQEKLKALAVDSGKGAVMPTEIAVEQAKYQPLARPLFIYVNAVSAQNNPLMNEFIDYYMRNAEKVVSSVGYIPFGEDDYMRLYRNYHKTKVGKVFGGQAQFNQTMYEVLTKRTEY